MKLASCAAALLLLAACTPAPEAPAPAATPPAPAADTATAPAPDAAPPPVEDPATAWNRRLGNLPPDAAAVIGRVEACNHFAGEDIAAREEADRKQAEATIAGLQCATVEADANAVRAMYGDRPDVMEALDMANRGIR